MLLGKVINNAASLNNFIHIDTVCYVLGDAVTMNFRIIDPQMKERFVPPSTAIVKVTFNNMDGTTLVKTGTLIDALDQSLINISLLTTDTTQLLGGNVTFTVDLLGDGTKILRGMIYSAISQVITNIPLL